MNDSVENFCELDWHDPNVEEYRRCDNTPTPISWPVPIQSIRDNWKNARVCEEINEAWKAHGPHSEEAMNGKDVAKRMSDSQPDDIPTPSQIANREALAAMENADDSHVIKLKRRSPEEQAAFMAAWEKNLNERKTIVTENPAPISIESIKRVRMEPGDVLLVKIKGTCSYAMIQRTDAQIRGIFGPDVKVMIVDDTADVSIIPPSKA